MRATICWYCAAACRSVQEITFGPWRISRKRKNRGPSGSRQPFHLGVLWQAQGDYEKSNAAFAAAIQLQPPVEQQLEKTDRFRQNARSQQPALVIAQLP